MLLSPSATFGQTWQVMEYYHLDAIGSVRAVTDAQGQVIARHDFLPFGEEVSPQTPPIDRLLFTGQVRDAETGLDYFHARQLRVDLGRFTTPDPLTDLAWTDAMRGAVTTYGYVWANPLGFVDPQGMQGWPTLNPDGTVYCPGGPCKLPEGLYDTSVTVELFTQTGGGGVGPAGEVVERSTETETVDGGGGGVGEMSLAERARCAAKNAGSLQKLLHMEHSVLASIFLSNDASAITNLVLGPDPASEAIGLVVDNPTKYNLIDRTMGVIEQVPTGKLITVSTEIPGTGGVIMTQRAALTVGSTAVGKAVSKTLVVWAAAKALFDAGAYFYAWQQCGSR